MHHAKSTFYMLLGNLHCFLIIGNKDCADSISKRSQTLPHAFAGPEHSGKTRARNPTRGMSCSPEMAPRREREIYIYVYIYIYILYIICTCNFADTPIYIIHQDTCKYVNASRTTICLRPRQLGVTLAEAAEGEEPLSANAASC